MRSNCTSTCLYTTRTLVGRIFLNASVSGTVVPMASGELPADCSISYLPVGYLSCPLSIALDFGVLPSMPQTHLPPFPLRANSCRMFTSLPSLQVSHLPSSLLSLLSLSNLALLHYFTLCLAVEAQARHLSGGAHTCPAAFDASASVRLVVASLDLSSLSFLRPVCCSSPPLTRMQTCAHSDKRYPID